MNCPEYGPQKCVKFNHHRPLLLGKETFPGRDGGRTIVSGVASYRIARIDVNVDGEPRARLTPQPDGSFLLVAQGSPHITYVVHHTDGTRDILDPSKPPRLGIRRGP